MHRLIDIELDDDSLTEMSYSEDNESDMSNDLIVDNEIVMNTNNAFHFRNIVQDDLIHMDSEKVHGHYYIGICKYFPRRRNILYLDSISSKTFFKFQFSIIMEYLKSYSIIHVENPKLHIMKLLIYDDGSYYVVLKTYWLRLIQRHWKRVFKERQEILRKRTSIGSILYFQQNGKYRFGERCLPNIIGMMSSYMKTCDKKI
jgi:hypothetical protein